MNADKPTLLVVDDTVENLDILVELLGDYDVRDVLDTEAALQVLEETPIDLILLDVMMPGVDGFEFCAQLQAHPRTRDIPVIFITARTDEAAIERAYELGGKDYVTKPFKPRELLARVRLQLQLRAMIGDLEYLAYHDTLTGVFNRRRFFDRAAQLFKESDTDLYAVMVDIDRFKRINDTHGHAVGDQVIRTVARQFSDALKPGAIFGRLGGEEFALVCSANSPEQVLAHIEGLRQRIAQEPIPAGEATLHVTISGGIARRRTGMRNIDALLRDADDALYAAKHAGRNRIVVA
ncbi:MAG: diguanylate cyclase [Halothiobacillaceae bacterium]|jgi:diguanylate cyclase (GGDEF)-like protein|nr:diguanylate cyclase [Halothiobacillaceae bacterium]